MEPQLWGLGPIFWPHDGDATFFLNEYQTANGPCPAWGLRASLPYRCSYMHCYSEVAGSTRPAIGGPLQNTQRGFWPGSFCFKVLCHLKAYTYGEQLTTPGLRMQKDGGGKASWPFCASSSGSRLSLFCEVVKNGASSEAWSLPCTSPALSRFSLLLIRKAYSRSSVGSLRLNTSHVSSFKYFFQFWWEEGHLIH